MLNKIGIQKQLLKTKSLRGLKLVFLLSMLFSIESFGQFTDCKKNNDDEPSYMAPGQVITGLPVYLEVDLSNWDNTTDSDFCIGNSGPNDTDGGCGTFIFKNFPKTDLVEDCTPRVCFSPRQGCGNALGNVCFWQENPSALGTWESLGSFDKDNFDELCLDMPADSDELAITICRPGQGPVSLQDVSFTSCEPEVTQTAPQESTQAPFCGVPSITCPTDFVSCPTSVYTPDVTGNPILTGSGSTCLITSFYSDEIFPITGCPNGANIVRTWTAHYEGAPDETVTCTQNLQLIDTEAPVINGVPADIAVSCEAVPDASLLAATDNCDPEVAVSYLEWRDNGACEHSYTLTRKYTATDACGNESSEMQIITVTDDTVPVIVGVPADEAVSYDEIPNAPILTATDNCDTEVAVSYLEWRDNGVCENNYTITRKWTATDDCGNEAIGMQILTVYDTAPPVLSLAPENKSVSCDAIPNALILTATDNSGADIVVEYLEWRDNGACEGNYVITRKWTAKDDCDNESIAMQIITVSDTSPPTFIEVPADVTIACAGALPTTTPTATDACGSAVTFDYTDTVVEGSCGDKTYTRIWTATDDCENTSNATQIIVVEGVMPLSIRNVPVDITLSCTDNIPAATLPNATTSCILDAIITFKEVSTAGQGTCANAYTITRTWTATDYCDNSVSASQVITITDEDAPVFNTIPANVAVRCEAVPNAPALIAIDGCDGEVAVNYLEWRDNGACENTYTITRKWTAIDACDNEAIVMQIISVSDNDAPMFANVPANVVINCGETLPSIITPAASDFCGTVSISLEETQTGETCGGYIHVRTWTATDACGNTSTAVQEIQVNGAPAISLSDVPGDTWFTCGQTIPTAGTVTAADACGNTYIVTYEETQSDDDCGSYTITRTWSTSDGCGAGASEHQTITVVDEEAPVFTGAPSDLTVTCESAIPSAPVLIATDNCGGNIAVDYLEWRDNGACDNTYTLTRKWTAADACGNEVIAMQIISISDDVAPTVNGVPADATVSCTTDLTGAPVLTATDACGENITVAYLEWRDNGACDSEYTITRKWSAVDACGNEGIGMQIITVTDDTAPTFTNVPANAVINCGEAIPTVATPSVSGVCGTATVSLAETQAGESCGGYILVRTWTAIDDCGNSSTAVQEIEVKGAPVISLSAVPEDTWFTCGQTIPAAGAVTAADACGNTYSITYAEVQSNDDCGTYTITRTWTASDGCGSAAVENQVITVTDDEAPVIAGTVADITIECGVAIPGAPVLTATDNCGGNIAVDYLEWRDNGTCVYEYTLTRKWTATDACGNEAIKMQIITVEDTTPPVITNAPANMVVNCGDAMPSPVYPTAQDACGDDVHITYEEVQNNSTSCGSSVVTRTWTIADDCGNATTLVQEITQNGSPAVNFNSVPQDISLGCGQAIPSSFNAVSATDGCGGTYLVDMTESSIDGTCGNTLMTRTWVADNGCGGTVSASQVITIAKPMVISFSEVPAAVTLACEQAISTAPALTASDDCGTTYDVSLTESTVDQGCGVSILTRTWTAFDACGNEYTTTQEINQKKSVGIFLYNIPRNKTVDCGAAIPAPYTVTANNLCGQSFAVNFTETTTGGDCGQQTITRTWMAEDDCGEQVIASQNITVNGASSIVFNDVPTDVTITCGQQIAPAATINATDACGNSYSVNVEESKVDGDCGNYTLLRTWSIANGCGGVETAFQTITVQDAGTPVLSGVPANATVACGATLPASANVIARDACGYNYTVALNETSVNHTNGSYTITKTWTAIDACGNAAEAVQTITVEGNSASINFQGVPANVNISCGDKVPDAAPVTANDTNDHYYGVNYTETTTDLGNGAYSLTRVWSAVDACGNPSTATQIITVQEAASMSLHSVPTNVTLTCGQAVPAAANVTATDANNNSYSVNYTETRTDGLCNSYTIVRTWSAAGGCSNDAVARQTITVEASTGPVLNGVPANITLGCGDAIPASSAVIARDACGFNYTVALTESTTNSDCGNSVITRTWSAIDACGNAATATQEITISGDAATAFSGIPSNANVSCGLNLPGAPTVTATNGCGASFTVSYEEKTSITSCGSSTVTRTWTAPDGCNGTITASQIIKLSNSPTITLNGVPTNATVACGQTIPTIPTVTGTDECGLNYTVKFIETQTGEDCGSYTLLRTWSAASACGVTEIGSQTITVEGGSAITLAGVPTNATVACGQTVPGAANVTAKDACGNSYIVNYNETQSGSTCGSYVLTRTWSASSTCDGSATAFQTITVEGGSAITLVGVPTNATVACGQTVPGAAYVTATDACGNSYIVNYNETQSGVSNGTYVLTRTWNAASTCGGTATASQTITVEGGSAISLTGVPTNTSIACGQAVPTVANVTATDASGNSYTVYLTEAQSGTTCTSYVLTRTWTASDNCNNTVTASQEITVQGAAAITFYEVPADLTIACGQAVPVKAPVYARDACGSSYIVSFNEAQTNGSTCGSNNTITRVWTATDACGNISTASHTLTVHGTPNISLAGVPADVTVSCDAVPTAANVTASDACGTNYGVALQEIIINVNCPQSYQIKRTWTSDDVCGSNASAIQLITVIDETAPELTCPDDMTINISLGNPISWEEPVATDNCGIVELIASHSNGGIFDAGVTVVTYTATDECNNTANCDFEIDVDIDAPQQSACQENIQITCSGTEQGIVTWSPPAIDLSCTSCSANPVIAGFVYMGERGGHRYYCSDTETTWHQANVIANQMGGYLAAIDDPAENAYLASFLTNQHAFIGLNDESSEGNFSWSNGQTLNFNNWYASQPNNYANAQHYVQLLYNGQWNDESASKLGEFIVEIPCVEVSYSADGGLNGGTFPAGTTTVSYKMKDKCGNIQNCDFDVTVTTDITMEAPEDIVVDCNGANGTVVSWVPPTATSCCNSCPTEGTDLPGFVYMGSYNGHQYYCSKEAAMWETANAVCNQYGGYLASINSADENDFLAAFLTTQSVFIGANDKAQEGNFTWASGEPMTYDNWYAGQPNNMNGNQDYCQMISDGRWDDIFNNAQLEFVLELPCTDVYQTDGPANGEVFPIGTTTVTYEAGDDCGNVTTQSFNVTVNECAQSQSAYTNQCNAEGTSTDYIWIDHIRVGSIDNCSGDNSGYGDFTSHATTMASGSSQSLYCYPGFGQGTYNVNWACWIDYNGDGDFDDANEEVFTYRHYNALRINFKVPHACVSGQVKMRIAMKYGAYATPCEIFEDGEVEDYTINLSSYGLRTTVAESRSSNNFEVEILEDVDLPAPTRDALPTTVAATEIATTVKTEMDVKVYPNPVQHELSIDIAGYEAIDGQLQIFNQLGQQVHQINLDNQTTQQVQVDVRDYMEGIYHIQLANGTEEPVTKQFIKIR